MTETDWRAGILGAIGCMALTQAGIAATPAASSQAGSAVRLVPLRNGLHMITSDAGNVTVQSGPDGLVVVDTLPAALSDDVQAALRTLSAAPVRYVINTTFTSPSTGGNARLAASPNPGLPFAAAATVVAHENVYTRLSTPAAGAEPMPSAAWPTEPYTWDKVDIHLNGSAIEVVHVPAATSDADSVVLFRLADAVSTGPIYVTGDYPRWYPESGGTIRGVIAALNRVLDFAVAGNNQTGGTLIIPGRGRLADESDVAEYRNMLVIIVGRIQALVEAGHSLEAVLAARPTRDYDAVFGSETGPWTTRMFVTAIYRELGK